jgi:hypothetical protein
MKKLLAFFSLLSTSALACPICNAAWESGEGMGFSKGVYYTTVLLLGAFFGMVSILVFYIYRQSKKPLPSWNRAEHQDALKSLKS